MTSFGAALAKASARLSPPTTADWSAVVEDGARPAVECHSMLLTAWTTGLTVLSTEFESPSVRAMLAVPVYRSKDRVAVVLFLFWKIRRSLRQTQ